jgi:methylglyoxal synthase
MGHSELSENQLISAEIFPAFRTFAPISPSFAMPSRHLSGHKRIALVAHDHKKTEIIEWALRNRETLIHHELYATGTTGRLIEDTLGVPVTKLLSGPLGGDQQIGAMIAEEKLDAIIFFWDPMESQPHDPDVKALLRLAVVWNIPMACNRATADFLLTSPYMNAEYDSEITDYSTYLKRQVGSTLAK